MLVSFRLPAVSPSKICISQSLAPESFFSGAFLLLTERVVWIVVMGPCRSNVSPLCCVDTYGSKNRLYGLVDLPEARSASTFGSKYVS